MSKKYILAIHAGHNASALIGDESGVLFAIQEERLTGEKNFWGFPEKSILKCLEYCHATPTDVRKVVFGTRQLYFRYHKREDVIYSYKRHDEFLGNIRQRFLVPIALKLKKNYGQKEAIAYLKRLGFSKDQVAFYNHHYGHALTAYYGLRKSLSEDYLVVTCDGSGEEDCATVRIMGPQGKNVMVARTSWDNSLGAMYGWTTYRMGFVPLEHEYKLMGMAPYAEPKYAVAAKNIFKKYLFLDKTGLKFERSTTARISDISKKIFKDLDGQRFDSVCAGLQMATEEILVAWIQNAIRKTGIKKVLAAGGVFMNVKANKAISEIPELEYFQAFPSCGDETLPFGAYFKQAEVDFGHDHVNGLKHFYLGDDIDVIEAEKAIKGSGFFFTRPENMAGEIAILLHKGNPVARCAGRMEFGARALGNRSILADPRNQDIVRVINRMVKKRDFWMPFAPIMKKDKASEYILNPKNLESPYMMMTFDTKDNFQEMIAAVHNADLTCRAQLLEPGQNHEVYSIIDEFQKLSGRNVLLNTSFNLHGFPIARTPEEALFILKNSGLEFMQVGPFLVKKRKS